jgi:RNA polymerase sigma-70 factor
MALKSANTLKTSLPRELYTISEAAKFDISREAFEELLFDIAQRYFPPGATSSNIIEFCRKLRLSDLVLAQACASGQEVAWNIFVDRYRSKLFRAAWRIVKDEGRARELVDTFCTDLFAIVRGRRRESKLKSYTGRGSLENWLKVSLLQANVDFHRAERRYTDFDEIATCIRSDPALSLEALDDPRIEDSLRDALRELPPEARFILAAYFLDRYNLAKIATVLGVHESTVSRHLEKTLKTVRKSLAHKLQDRGMNRRSIRESLERSPKGVSFDMRSELLFGIEERS